MSDQNSEENKTQKKAGDKRYGQIAAICAEAVELFGPETQREHLEEELTELLLAIKHFRRKKIDFTSLVEEFCDVQIMLYQGMEIYGITPQVYGQCLDRKLTKLIGILEKEKDRVGSN